MKALLAIAIAATVLLVTLTSLASAQVPTEPCRNCKTTSGDITLPKCKTSADRTDGLCPKGPSGGTGCWYGGLACQAGYSGDPCKDCKYKITRSCQNNGGGCIPFTPPPTTP